MGVAVPHLLRIADWGEDLRANVVFLHGLNGDPYKTWQSNKDDSATLWPLWLARDVSGLAVHTVQYDAPKSRWRRSMNFIDTAAVILDRLVQEPALQEAPIIFVCHSLGGLILKQILFEAEIRRINENFCRNACHMVFLGTPQTGAGLAKYLAKGPAAPFASDFPIVLQENNPLLRNLDSWFAQWASRANVRARVYAEAHATHGFQIVDTDRAATKGSPDGALLVDADHTEISKPINPNTPSYQRIKADIQSRLAEQRKTGTLQEVLHTPPHEQKKPAGIGNFKEDIFGLLTTAK
jgi:predicted alpha/beta hydrolase family esterase